MGSNTAPAPVGYASGKRRTFRQPFRGTVAPDGAGGSILRGAFRSSVTEETLRFLRDHFDEVVS